MSYPHVFGSAGMGALADQIDQIRVSEECGFKPSKDGTGSPTAIAQYGYHQNFFDKNENPSWRDLARVRLNEVFSYKDPTKLQEALVQLMVVCADWHEDIERRRNDG